MRVCIVAVAAALLVTAETSVNGQQPEIRAAADTSLPAGRMVTVGNHALHVLCVGQGSPTVVFESGGGSATTAWRRVLPDVGAFTRACAYDRSGIGRSAGGQESNDPDRVAAELRALLTAAGEREPFVLVGHSNGGLYARAFVARFPAASAGLVLVDASDENFYDLAKPFMPSDHWRMWVQSEAAAAGRAREAPKPRVPVIVLTSDQSGTPAAPGYDLARLRPAWRDAHAITARRLGGRHVVVEGTSHFIQLDRPDVVVQAVRDVIAAALKR